MSQIECGFCGAYATKIPGPTVYRDEWEAALVVLRKGAFWGLPLDSKLKKLEASLAEALGKALYYESGGGWKWEFLKEIYRQEWINKALKKEGADD